jgi:hypothetical protein
MIFESIATNEFGVYVGPYDLTTDNIMNLTTPVLDKCFESPGAFYGFGNYTWSDFSSEIAAGNFTRLSLSECRNVFDDLNAAGTKALMVLVKELSVKDGGDLAVRFISYSGLPDSNIEDYLIVANSTSVTTKVDATLLYPSNGTSTTSGESQNITCILDSPSYDGGSIDGGFTIQDCVQVSAEEKCQLLYSPTICIVVSLCALAKVIAMFFAARISRSRSTPLLTLGDAVASFVTRPDSTTRGMCWITKRDVTRGLWGTSGNSMSSSTSLELVEQDETNKVIIYKKLVRRKWYMQVPSKKRWAGTLLL